MNASICIYFNWFLLFLLSFFIHIQCYAQQNSFDDVLIYIDNLYGAEHSEYEITELENLLENPICLNSLTEIEVEKLLFLSDFQKKSLLHYVESNTPLRSIYEIQFADGFSRNLAYMVSKFSTLQCDAELKSNNVKTVFQTIIAYKKSEEAYFGNDIYLKSRLICQSRDFEVNLGWEKDRGEQFLVDGNVNNFTFGAEIHQKRTELYLGNMKALWGQGLVLSTNMFNTSVTASSARKTETSLGLNTSHLGNGELRGIGVNYKYKNISATGIVSQTPLDANLTPDEKSVKSLYGSDYFRNFRETKKKNAVNLFLTGTRLVYKNHILSGGLSAVHGIFSKPFAEDSLKQFSRIGADIFLRKKRFDCWSEFALLDSRIKGVSAINIVPSSAFAATILLRYYDRNSVDIFSSGISSSSSSKLEFGIFTSIQYTLGGTYFLSVGFDKYRFSPMEQYYQKLILNTEVNLFSVCTFRSQFKYSLNEKNVASRNYIFYPISDNFSVKLNAYLTVGEVIDNKAIDISLKYWEKNNYSILFQSIIYNNRENPISIYENGVYTDFSFVKASGSGMKNILVISKNYKRISLQGKVSFADIVQSIRVSEVRIFIQIKTE